MMALKKAWYQDEEDLRLKLGIKTRDEFISLQAKAIVRRQVDLYKSRGHVNTQEEAQKK
jgi:hypothetical protein